MGWITSLLQGIGALLAKLLPSLIREWGKPSHTEIMGADKKAQAFINQGIRDQLAPKCPKCGSRLELTAELPNELYYTCTGCPYSKVVGNG